ncbi:hypothetical protein HYC85_003010 [Camellia sinensis]|uniref:Vesicle transport v-SNARE N-terminal domain-containing protein n=1 Tax=Camellia sinensis TaxID=4442 RepID=A0A7J7IB53_CAMSI|nr:hypothetical protein HYC85_003010 [Camellia sinensis]
MLTDRHSPASFFHPQWPVSESSTPSQSATLSCTAVINWWVEKPQGVQRHLQFIDMASRRHVRYSRLAADEDNDYDAGGYDPRYDYTPKSFDKVPWKSIFLSLFLLSLGCMLIFLSYFVFIGHMGGERSQAYGLLGLGILTFLPEQKKQKFSEVKAGLDEAESLIRKMDLEARSLQRNVKVVLLSKLREYKSDLNNLKAEVKRITSTNLNQAARDELLESGMADALTVSADQRARLLMSTERINKSSDRVRESRRTMLETEELGVSILQDLHQQRQSLLHTHDTLHGVDDNIGRSKKILTNISRRMSRNKWIIGSIIAVLVVAIILILYFKLSK